MRRLSITATCLLLSCAFAGCGDQESDEERLQRLVPNASSTVKVSGSVTVDGEKIKDIWVKLHPVQPDSQLQPRAQTDANGEFQITTYITGDGAPAGDYKITFEWLNFSRMGGAGWVGPDKLKNQYNDPKTTPFDVSVKDSPIELPVFELKVAGVPDKPGTEATPPVQFQRQR